MMKDIATWRTETDLDGYARFQSLYPGIVRLGLDNEEPLVLVRPAYVFYKSTVSHQSKQPPPRPTGHAASHPGSPKPSRMARSRTRRVYKGDKNQSWFTWSRFLPGNQSRKPDDTKLAKGPSGSRPQIVLERNPLRASSGTWKSDPGMDVRPFDKGFKGEAEIPYSPSQAKGSHPPVSHGAIDGPIVEETPAEVQEHYPRHEGVHGNANA